jgi:hypothetical protein
MIFALEVQKLLHVLLVMDLSPISLTEALFINSIVIVPTLKPPVPDTCPVIGS